MVRWILIAVLLIIVARMFWKLVDNVIEAAGGAPRGRQRTAARSVRLARDPVCGTHVAPGSSLSLTSGGATLYFCSEKCRTAYRKRS